MLLVLTILLPTETSGGCLWPPRQAIFSSARSPWTPTSGHPLGLYCSYSHAAAQWSRRRRLGSTRLRSSLSASALARRGGKLGKADFGSRREWELGCGNTRISGEVGDQQRTVLFLPPDGRGGASRRRSISG